MLLLLLESTMECMNLNSMSKLLYKELSGRHEVCGALVSQKAVCGVRSMVDNYGGTGTPKIVAEPPSNAAFLPSDGHLRY